MTSTQHGMRQRRSIHTLHRQTAKMLEHEARKYGDRPWYGARMLQSHRARCAYIDNMDANVTKPIKCDECDRWFHSQEALGHHRGAKGHFPPEMCEPIKKREFVAASEL